MNEGLKEKVCHICGDPRTENSERCKECEQRFKEGYIAMVVADPEKSKKSKDGRLKQENAYRTGTIVHIGREMFETMFHVKPDNLDMVFIEPDVAVQLEGLINQIEK